MLTKSVGLHRIGKIGITAVCITVAVMLTTWPIIEKALNAAMGNAPLVEIQLGDDPGSVGFSEIAAPSSL